MALSISKPLGQPQLKAQKSSNSSSQGGNFNPGVTPLQGSALAYGKSPQPTQGGEGNNSIQNKSYKNLQGGSPVSAGLAKYLATAKIGAKTIAAKAAANKKS